MKKITIFTPTYNRAFALPRLYESLCRQTQMDYIWFIVDDGSTDETESLVKQWQIENKIEIIFHKQENRGKMSAHNYGVMHCTTPFFSCVDSDDYLFDNAIELIYDNLNKVGPKSIIGLIAPRAMKKAGRLETHVLNSSMTTTLYNLYKSGFRGETTIVFKSDLVRHFLFPEIDGEKFIRESYIYDQIDQQYAYYLLTQPLVICEFYQDGYTKNIQDVFRKNPKGCALYYNQYVSLFPLKIKQKIYTIMLYIIYAKLGKNKNVFKDAKCGAFYFFMAWFFSFFYRKRIVNK